MKSLQTTRYIFRRAAAPPSRSIIRATAFGNTSFASRLVRADPIQQARRVLGQHQRIALPFARAVDDPFELSQILLHRRERLVRLQTEVDDPPRRLRRGHAHCAGLVATPLPQRRAASARK